MQATTVQIFILVFTSLLVIGVSIISYLFSIKKDKAWFYAYATMLMILVQWMSDTGSSLIYQNYFLHLASIILFPSIIFSLFIIYILQGSRSVRQLLYMLLIGELGYVISVGFLSLLGNTPSYIQIGWPWISNHLFSSLAIIIDYFFLLAIWPIIHNPKYKLPLFIKVWLVCWILLIMDSLIFTLGTFWDNPIIYEIIMSNIIIRSILSVIITPLISLYVQYTIKENGDNIAYRRWDSILGKNEEIEIAIQESKEKVDKLEKLELEMTQRNIELENQRKAIANILDDVQKDKENALNLAEELRRFKIAAEQSNEMIVFTDAEGIVLWGNKATEVITGFTKEEAVGKKAGVLWGKLMPKEWYQDLWKTVKIDKKIFVSEIQNHRKNGERFLSSFIIYPLLDSSNNVQFFVATQRDITKEKEIDRMKTEFLSVAAHQLRTPLGSMRWNIEMLLSGDLGDLGVLQPEVKETISSIYDSNRRLIDLVNDLLNVSRIDQGRVSENPQPTDINTVIVSVLKDLKPLTIEQDIKLIFNPINIPNITLDSKHLHEVISNLLSNAIKYNKKSGSVELTTKLTDDIVELKIIDTGMGIPEVDMPRLGSKFFRAENAILTQTEGSGLGLFVAKSYVEAWGGILKIESKIGNGTTVTISLPLTPKSHILDKNLEAKPHTTI